jgi:cardiolipin hydrolase
MKDFDYILEKILSDKKFSRSEQEAFDKVLESASYSESQLALLRSKLFDHIKGMFDSKEERGLVEALEDLNKALLPPQKANVMAEAHFSPGLDCLDAINRQIRYAKSTLDICVFTISDNRIVDNIEDAHTRGVKVRIISDDDKQYDRGNDIFRMKDFGIPVVTDSTSNHMHHKFAIIDQKVVICGSYNWTRSAATRNNEDIVVQDTPVIVKGFISEFERLWKEFS